MSSLITSSTTLASAQAVAAQVLILAANKVSEEKIRKFALQHSGLVDGTLYGIMELPREKAEEYKGIAWEGLLKASKAYLEKTPDFKFDTYAIKAIKNTVINELRKENHLENPGKDTLKLLDATTEKLCNSLQRRPTSEEILGHSGLKPQCILEALSFENIVSLDTPIRDGENEESTTTFLDLTEECDRNDPAQIVQDKFFSEDLTKIIASLPDTYRQIIELYFFEGLTQEEIGESFLPEKKKKVIHHLIQDALQMIRAKLNGAEIDHSRKTTNERRKKILEILSKVNEPVSNYELCEVLAKYGFFPLYTSFLGDISNSKKSGLLVVKQRVGHSIEYEVKSTF